MTQVNPDLEQTKAQADSGRAQTKTCRYCSSDIPLSAKVCKDCNRRQDFFGFLSTEATVTLIAVVSIFLSWQQTQAAKVQAVAAQVQNEEAKKERIAAEEAARRAEEALKLARITEANLKGGLVIFAGVEYMRQQTRFTIPTPDKIQAEIGKDVDRLLFFAMPDGTDRAKWLNGMNVRINNAMKP